MKGSFPNSFLPIADVLALEPSLVCTFEKANIAANYNLMPSHDCDQHLLEMVANLMKLGLLEYSGIGQDRIRLTSVGAREWENTRQPDWSKFVQSYQSSLDTGGYELTIRSFGNAIAWKRFIDLIEDGTVDPELVDFSHFDRTTDRLIYWKQQGHYTLVVRHRTEDSEFVREQTQQRLRGLIGWSRSPLEMSRVE